MKASPATATRTARARFLNLRNMSSSKRLGNPSRTPFAPHEPSHVRLSTNDGTHRERFGCMVCPRESNSHPDALSRVQYAGMKPARLHTFAALSGPAATGAYLSAPVRRPSMPAIHRVGDVCDEHVSRRMRDGERRLGGHQRCLRRHPTGPEHRHVAVLEADRVPEVWISHVCDP